MCRRVLLPIAILGFVSLTTACDSVSQVIGGKFVKGSGISAKVVHDVSEFDELDVQGALSVRFRPGDERKVIVEGDDNIVGLVTVSVNGDTLRLRTESNVGYDPEIPLRIHVIGPELRDVEVGGASSVTLELVDVAELELKATGASSISGSGKAGTVELEASGASTIELSDLDAKTVELKLSGASTAVVVADKEIEGSASGASRILWGGNAQKMSVKTTGASRIDKFDVVKMRADREI